jgi:hypothetical protein
MSHSSFRSRILRVAAELPQGDSARRDLLAALSRQGGAAVGIAVYKGKMPSGHQRWEIVSCSNSRMVGMPWAAGDSMDTSSPQLVSFEEQDQFCYPVPWSKVRP